MLTNVSYQDSVHYIAQPTSAVVEQIPSIPELKQWILIQQHKKTLPYTLANQWDDWANVTNFADESVLSKVEKQDIIRNANQVIVQDSTDLDPKIRSLVNDNFEELLWK